MPQLGETVTEGTVTKWLKAVGDTVAVDDVLFEVSTDKVDTEVPSAVAGVLAALYVAEGDTVAIGTRLAAIAADLTEAAGIADQAEDPQASAPTAEIRPVERATRPESVARSSGRSGDSNPDRSSGRATTSTFLSPAVRGLLDEHGLGERDVTGSGRGGRVTRADVLAAAARVGHAGAGRASASASSGGRLAPYPAAAVGPDDDVIEFTKARRATAEHMVRSQATSAHTLVAVHRLAIATAP